MTLFAKTFKIAPWAMTRNTIQNLTAIFTIAALCAAGWLWLRQNTVKKIDYSTIHDIVGLEDSCMDQIIQQDEELGFPDLWPAWEGLQKCFVSKPGIALTRERIAVDMWGAQFTLGDIEPRTVDRHVTTLRKKIGAQHISAVPRVGYRFDPEGPPKKPGAA